MSLPDFVPPMLARLGRKAFDSDQHLFEVKWDGIRALTFTEGGSYRALTRNRHDLVPRYPELAVLGKLPAGLVLDGELVVLDEGKPHFQRVLQREQARNPLKIEALARSLPATYVVFDLLYKGGEPLLDLPLHERREALAAVVEAAADPHLVLSEGIVGAGLALFEQVSALGLEGMVAKELSSRYLPGKRTDAWTKIKTFREAVCAILGYLAEGEEVRSLIVALEEGGELVCVGRVGSGLSASLGRRLHERFLPLHREEPLIPCGEHIGQWVEPGLFCRVRFLERTENGLRAPVFLELLEGELS